MPATLFLTAAYRPEVRSAESTQLLHDIACLIFVGMANMVVMQNLVIGLAILRDRNERRIFPRWAGYISLWSALLLAPGFCVYLFRSGPLSWNGIFAWWVPVLAFGVWYAVMIVLVYRAIADEERETAPTHPPVVPSPAQ